ncbi:MAG: magnesium transporter [Bacilli bacterium]|jgi:magnesium transporter
MEKETLTLEQLLHCIHAKDVPALRQLFETYEPVDVAEICDEIDEVADLLFIFKTVKSDYTSELFAYLTDDQQAKLINLFNDKQLMELIQSSYTDDIVDFLIDMPANLVSRVLNVSDKTTRAEINSLLNYKEGTAGSIMTTEYVLFPNNFTVADALARIRAVGRDKETIATSFVVDDKRILIGVVYIDDLIYSEPETKIIDIMNRDFIVTTVNADQEEVAQLFKRYDLNVMPVLNDDQRLIGIVTIDDVMDVIDKEASEDILKMAAINPLEESYTKSSVTTLAKKSLPWLLVLMILGAFSTIILNRFEHAFEQVVILSAFIPVLMDTGGNAGNQSSTLITRGIALKEIDKHDFRHVLFKELRVALLVGLAVAAFSFLWIFVEISTGILVYDIGAAAFTGAWFLAISKIAGLVSATLFFAILISKMVGGSLPLLALAIKKDPAVMSSPFVTTIVDVTALLIYFFLSSYVFNLF